jgi:hypothetical protein
VCGVVAQRAYRGMAFRHQGMHDAAHESLKEALKARSRDMSIRHLALSERAETYLAQNKKARPAKTSNTSWPTTRVSRESQSVLRR